MLFAEEILDLFLDPDNRTLTAGTETANLIGQVIEPIFDPENLETKTVFISVVSLTYMVVK